MTWRIEVKRSAEKELRGLSSEARQRIAVALRAMQTDPFPPRHRKLVGSDRLRIRVGDYRILYTVDVVAASVWIVAIGHRRDVYR